MAIPVGDGAKAGAPRRLGGLGSQKTLLVASAPRFRLAERRQNRPAARRLERRARLARRPRYPPACAARPPIGQSRETGRYRRRVPRRRGASALRSRGRLGPAAGASPAPFSSLLLGRSPLVGAVRGSGSLPSSMRGFGAGLSAAAQALGAIGGLMRASVGAGQRARSWPGGLPRDFQGPCWAKGARDGPPGRKDANKAVAITPAPHHGRGYTCAPLSLRELLRSC